MCGEGVGGGLGWLLVLEPLAPLGRGVDVLAAVFCAAGANAEHQGRVDAGAAYDDLAFAEGRKLFEHVAADGFDGLGDAVLVDGVGDAHDALGHALAEHVAVETAGALRDEADADAELASFAEDGLEDVRTDGVGIGGGEVVGFFEEAEDGKGHVVAVPALEFAFLGVDSGLIYATQEGGDDHLLLPLFDFIQLDQRARPRLEQLIQFDIFKIVEECRFRPRLRSAAR